MALTKLSKRKPNFSRSTLLQCGSVVCDLNAHDSTDRYKKILPVRFKDEVAGLSELHMKILASALVDALLFAALPSVPRMIGLCFGLQYSQWGVDNLSEDARTLTESKLWTYTMVGPILALCP